MKSILKSLRLILVVASAVASQSLNGSISGTVKDMFGAVIPNIEVKLIHLTKEKEEIVARTVSDPKGAYTFSDIPLGLYEMQVKWLNDNIIRKRVELTSSSSVQKNINISREPCSNESETTIVLQISNGDRAEIVRELLNLEFPKPVAERIVFVPRNIDVVWLGAEQKAKLNILTRADVQALAEKNRYQDYYWISPIKQFGGCIEVTMHNDSALKGQIEDANMAGGGMIYEFRKIAGRWIGQAIGGWIS